ncbi:dual specificity protein phosphatase 9 [Gracilinanus agilis]|uniref:dual specificity protein phosphatase 9 n=1 Tax=Gracilinanus agilis TaxID=191870 RepID=UPI001CFEBCF2|nr:dual specificity protein phosphatase 9 [Gracilinanus agilis]
MEGLGRSPLWLSRELAAPQPQLLLLDCRSRELYESGHVQGALSVALPALLLRRLRKGNLSVCSLLPSPLHQQRQPQQPLPLPPLPILLYDEGRCVEEEEAEAAQSVLATLLQKLQEEGHPAYYLQDEAVSQNCGVLVHCLAGISRSVTVTVAYLMQKLHLSLNDAYDLVKRQKSNISPNFNFMGQLLDFEHSLKLKGEGPRDQRDGQGVEGNQPPTPPCFFTTPTGEGVFELDST